MRGRGDSKGTDCRWNAFLWYFPTEKGTEVKIELIHN
jgi:hypothetical protein